MRYNRLHINQFGTLQNRTLDFSEGINVIQSTSEEDKAALCAFIEAIHFGMDPQADSAHEDNLYARYYPEEGRSTYGGVLEFTQNDHIYSIFRNFRRDPRGLTLMDESSNRSAPLTEADYQELLHHMSQALYRDTLALNPLTSSQPRELAAELQQHITNLRETGSASLDVEQTRRQLLAEQAGLEEQFSQEAEDRNRELALKIRELTAQRDSLPSLNDLPQGEDEKNQLQTQLAQLITRQEELTDEIQEHEDILRDHSRYAKTSLKEAEDRCQRLIARREKLLSHYPEPSTSVVSRLSPAFTILLFILCVSSVIFTVLSLAQGQFFNALLGLIVIVLSGATIPHMARRWSALRRFYYVDNDLRRLYQEILTDAPDYVTQENLQDFIETMNSLKGHRRSLAQCRKEMRTISDQLKDKQDQYKRLQEFLEEKRKDILKKQLIDEHICQLEEEQESLIPALENNENIQLELEAVAASLQTIEELSHQAYRVFTSFLQDNTTQLLSQLYDGQDIRLDLSQDGPVILYYEGQKAHLHQLDCGTLEQIYLLLRIACIQFFWKKDSMPILMDNSFRLCDETKFIQTLSWLSENYSGQLFLFTCRDYEADLLQSAGIPFTNVQI